MIGELTRKQISEFLGKPLQEVQPQFKEGMEAVCNAEGRVIEIRYKGKRIRPCDNRTLGDIETVYDNLLLDMLDELESYHEKGMFVKVKTMREFFDKYEAQLEGRVQWFIGKTGRYV